MNTKKSGVIKGFILGVVSTVIISGTVAFAAGSPYKFIVNGVDKTPKNGIYIKKSNSKKDVLAGITQNGQVYVPVKMAAEMLGTSYTYDSKKRTVYLGSKKYVKEVPLTDLPLADIKIDGDEVFVNDNMKIKKRDYKGLTIYSWSSDYSKPEVTYDLNGNYDLFSTSVAIDDKISDDSASVEIVIKADGTEIYKTYILKGTKLIDINLDITGVNELTISITKARNTYTNFVNPLLIQTK